MPVMTPMTCRELTRRNVDEKKETHMQDDAERSGSVRGVLVPAFTSGGTPAYMLTVDVWRNGTISNIYADSYHSP